MIGGDRLSLAGATVLNGFLITAVTMCDVHRSTLTHITPEVVPPALAIAERDGRAGRDLLVALAAGFEAMTRIGIGLDYPAFRARGWHGPGVLGPFGAAAAVGRLRIFDAETMAKAFGLAGSQSAGTFAAWATPTVKFHQCRGALSGLMAALLAEQKFLATREFLTAKDGGSTTPIPTAASRRWRPPSSASAGSSNRLRCGCGRRRRRRRRMNTALFDLIEKHTSTPTRSRSCASSLSQAVFDLHGKLPNYKGKFDALISAHYIAAVILHDRELTLTQFEPARYDDPKLRRAAAEQIEVKPDPALSGIRLRRSRSRWPTARSSASRCEHPRGSPKNPLSRAQIETKFRTYAKGVLSDAHIEEAIAAVNRLEDLASARELMDLLRGSAKPVRGSRAA